MTISQISNAGIVLNKWTTLQNVCSSMLFSNEAYVYTSPKTAQYYFEENTGLLFVRNTRSTLYSTIQGSSDDYVEVTLLSGGAEKNYYLRLVDGGATDNKVGRFHAVYDVAEITAIL